MDLVIVESPAKAKTIEKYLGGDYQVLASFGHLRDLVAKDGAVRPDEDFSMSWQISPERIKQINDIAKALKKADRLILATDPDREGEAIAWHLLEVLRERELLKDLPIERVAFNAITKTAVLEAMASPRKLDEDLVDAYLARRALDYLVGFNLSPVLWRKLPGIKSAGRVQSSALRLICERETEREDFIPRDFWTIDINLLKDSEKFSARLNLVDEIKLGKFTIKNPEEAEGFRMRAEAAKWVVENSESKPIQRHPTPPFTTSTLQQEASRKLGFSAQQTMRCAQKLYDGSLGAGLITYMRTDSVNIVPSALEQTRTQILTQFGESYLPQKPNYYKGRAKNAQEAHEAIRPTNAAITPALSKIGGNEGKLYQLIWKRAIASQMASAKFLQTQLILTASEKNGEQLGANAVGRVLVFDGFLKVYFEGRDLPQNNDSDDIKEQKLPQLEAGETLKTKNATSETHTTQAKPRFTEASLVKRMEELGIGRPSTYAPTMDVLRQRNYVLMEKKQLVPDSRGRIVVEFLKKYFAKYINYDFTSDLEEQLDKIAEGNEKWRWVLNQFWTGFIKSIDDTAQLRTTNVLDSLNETMAKSVFSDEKGGRVCAECKEGELSIKLGKYGAFVGCNKYPECKFTRPLTSEGSHNNNRTLGVCPETKMEIFAKDGRYGAYIERALIAGEEKPKRCTIPKTIKLENIELELALKLLALPRSLGVHPETSKEIIAGLGRFGGFVKSGKLSANLKKIEDITSIGLEEAVVLLEKSKTKPKRRKRAAPKGVIIGTHPKGGEIQLLKGRFGPYVSLNKVNASLGAILEENLSLADAIELIDARIAKVSVKSKTKPKAKSKTKSKPAAKKKAST